MISKYKIRVILFLSLGVILLSSVYLGVSSLKSGFPLFNFAQAPAITEDITMDSSDDFAYFKQFTVTDNTGLDQKNVIIDPVQFTEESGYCFKDSIRVYKYPYNASDELISQVYNIKPHAWDTFSNDPDWGLPSSHWSSYGTIRILPRFNGYEKVVELKDETGSGWERIRQYPNPNAVSGTMYFIVSVAQSDMYVDIGAGNSGTAIQFGFHINGNLFYQDDATFPNGTGILHDTGIPYSLNTWYTFKSTFDCVTNKQSIWVWNDSNAEWITIANNVNMCKPRANLDYIFVLTDTTGGVGTVHVAAFDCSWAPGYQEDRILSISSADVAFIDNLTASETKTYRVYYNSTPTKPAAYTDISRTNYTVNFEDGASAIMYVTNLDMIRQFDKNGNEHLSGYLHFFQTYTYEWDGGEAVTAVPIISDGPIFIEAWHIDSSAEWSLYRYYKNSYIYKYKHFSGVGKTGYCVFGHANFGAGITIDFSGSYYHQASSWQYEAFDSPSISWENHPNEVDAGKMFQDETGDSNILVTLWDTSQDPYLDDILIREADFPNPAAVYVTIGRNPVNLDFELTSSFGIWQLYQDVGSTNVTDKQNFVDTIYEAVIDNPPTISMLAPRNMNITDYIVPNILEVSRNLKKPRPLDPLNITAHVTDNEQISHVLLYTDLFGSFQYFDMNLTSGSISDGYWSYNTTIPMNASKKTISYQIWANDTSGMSTISDVFQFKVKKNPKPIVIIPPGEDITIIIIIIIGSVAASALVVTTIIIRKRVPKIKSKKIMKAKYEKTQRMKAKYGKRIDLGADEIRQILAESDQTIKLEKVTYDQLKSKINSPISSISEEIYTRVQNLKSLTKQEKELLLKDLVSLDDTEIEEWLTEIEELEE
ncbi:MAG: hypothetical protein ACFFCM_00800 [Promethearchaeota archaeon]